MCTYSVHAWPRRGTRDTRITRRHSSARPNMVEQVELFDEIAGISKRRMLDANYIRNWNNVIVDGILGSGIQDPPQGVSASAIQACSDSNGRILSIDLPSGLNHVTGEAPGACIQATWTVNLHMFKSGQLQDVARLYIGQLWSAETALGFTTFGNELTPKFMKFYKDDPIRRVW